MIYHLQKKDQWCTRCARLSEKQKGTVRFVSDPQKITIVDKNVDDEIYDYLSIIIYNDS